MVHVYDTLYTVHRLTFDSRKGEIVIYVSRGALD